MSCSITLPEKLVKNVKNKMNETGATFSGIIRVALKKFIGEAKAPPSGDVAFDTLNEVDFP